MRFPGSLFLRNLIERRALVFQLVRRIPQVDLKRRHDPSDSDRK